MVRPRRTGISYIENHNSRSISFFKRRAGLYKAAADLSTLTGARVDIMLEAENGKMSSFGTPSPGPIIDSFLSGHVPVNPFINEEQKADITALQNELFTVERGKFMEDRRIRVTIARAKEIQETSRMAKLVSGKIDDLSVEELNELLHRLAEIGKHIDGRGRPQQPSYQPEVGGSSRDPFLRRLSSSSTPSQILMPPRRLPWTPIQPSLHHPRSSWSLPQLSRSQSSLLNPSFQAPAQQMPLSQNTPMPQNPSVVQPQAQMMLSPTETYQHNYNNTQGIHHINGNIPQPFSQSALMSALPPPLPSSSAQIAFYNGFPPPSSSQQPPTPLPIEAALDPAANPQNPCDFTAGHPFANHQWTSPIPSNEPYYDTSLLYGLNLSLGDHVGYGGQTARAHDMPGPSGLHQQPYDFLYRNFLGSSLGASHVDYSTENNHGDMVWISTFHVV